MMNKMRGCSFWVLLLLLSACQSDQKKIPATALETGRVFIEDCMKGDFNDASVLLLKDSTNSQLFSAFENYYSKMPDEKKQHYKTASYTINKYSDIDDSSTIINYSNDYMNKPMEIKIVRKNEQWLVDFKYTYSGNLPIN